MVLSDMAKRGLECGAWIDWCNNQNKDKGKRKKCYPYEQIRVRYILRAVYHNKNM